MGGGGEAEITSIQASTEHSTPHNYIFLPGNAEHRSWARSSARIIRGFIPGDCPRGKKPSSPAM